jgi:hypothetical protein
MFFTAIKDDDPRWFAKRLEGLYDVFEDPNEDCVKVPSIAKQVAFNMGRTLCATRVQDYMG